MHCYIVKAKNDEGYLKQKGDSFEWDSGKHAFVLAHVFEDEEEAKQVAAQFDGHVLFLE